MGRWGSIPQCNARTTHEGARPQYRSYGFKKTIRIRTVHVQGAITSVSRNFVAVKFTNFRVVDRRLQFFLKVTQGSEVLGTNVIELHHDGMLYWLCRRP